METFNFPVHTIQIRYPEQTSVKFGKGYAFGVKPLLPTMREFILTFSSMRWISTDHGTSYSSIVDPTRNMKTLLDFYDEHQMFKRFTYSNPLVGTTVCRFGKPLETPKAHKGGTGWTEEFEILLQEQAA